MAALTATEPKANPAGPFTQARLSGQGQWLIDRIRARWPHWTQAVALAKIRGWLGSPGYCLTAADGAVALGVFVREELESAPSVRVLFLFADDGAEGAAVHLVRFLEAWGAGQGCARISIDPETCDVAPGALRDRLKAQTKTVLVKALRRPV